MKLGTPLSSSATRVMLLGSGELGKEVIIALQRYGIEVIAVDRYPNAPGHQLAHRSHVIDMTDGKSLREVILKERPHIVIPEIEALATDALVEIEQEGITEIIPSARAVQLTMNREGIRRLVAEELELPTSKYAFAKSLNELMMAIDSGIGYPCVIKPIMSSSGKGQSVIYGPDDIEDAWNYAMRGARVSQQRIIVEEMIEFDYEITLLTVRAKGADGVIQTHFCQPIGHLQEQGDYIESWQPQVMAEGAYTKAQQIAKTVTDELGGCGVFGVELFIKGDQVWFSEVSPRPHDTGMVTMISQFLSEFELHARAVLGLPVSTAMTVPAAASAVIYGGMDEKAISFEGVDLALQDTNTEIRIFGKPEAFIRRRMGVALASGQNIEESRAKAKAAAGKLIPLKS